MLKFYINQSEFSRNKKGTQRVPFFIIRNRLLLKATSAETLIEAINTTTGSRIFLLAGIERVALTANIDMDVFTNS